jgi:anion-transporting  ArsA/GET3 family ATPase
VAVSRATDELADARLVVVAGTGGVGKTTVSAIIGIALAKRGRRVCVLTVDPARRLASALGLDGSLGEPTEIPGDWPGVLTAVQLDAGRTFDGLLERYGAGSDVVTAMRTNPIYRSLAAALGGTQEYMAVERVHELLTAHPVDVVVVDTPPTRNAVDLLDAPGRLLRFLTHPIVRVLVAPGRASLRAASLAAAAATRTIGAVVGIDIVNDVVSFFQAFASLHDGFIDRAREIEALLRASGTRYVVVTSPAPAALIETEWFLDELARRHLDAHVVVVNRAHPQLVTLDERQIPSADGALGAYFDNARDLATAYERDRFASARFTSQGHVVATIPLRARALTDVAELAEVARSHL